MLLRQHDLWRATLHYSRTCSKTQKVEGIERLSFLERVHPSLQCGRRLFQHGER
jgi:hypothetical protein